MIVICREDFFFIFLSVTIYIFIIIFSIFVSIDATDVSGLGKMVNDAPDRHANAKMKRQIIGDSVYLCLFATGDIPTGTEIRLLIAFMRQFPYYHYFVILCCVRVERKRVTVDKIIVVVNGSQ